MGKGWLFIATASGFLSVALGAIGAHTLRNILDGYGKSIYEKAVLYQMFHTLALFVVGFCQLLFRNMSFSMPGILFLMGILLFSGSLYLLAVTGMKWLGAITPIGGTAFLLGWAWLGYTIIKAKP
ncbi:MAG: DUF423 domain-containing protein [Deltaproteobacteria bacterium]|nr:MAG: DUF423 domain-containing protein [Deltaproteobacteria bacterium]